MHAGNAGTWDGWVLETAALQLGCLGTGGHEVVDQQHLTTTRTSLKVRLSPRPPFK